MKKQLTLLASIFVATSLTSHAATGMFGSYIGINPNGAGNTWYGAQEWGATDLTDFDGLDLGTINLSTGSLQISAFQGQTFKSGGGNVTAVDLNYRVFKVGDTPGSFNVVNAGFLSDSPFTSAAGNSTSGGGDQNWGVNPTATLGNLIAGISTNGTYSVEMFLQASTNEGDRFSNNAGSNYTATFTAVPEPSTYAIMIAATLGLVLIARRRRA